MAYVLCNIAWQYDGSFIPVGRRTLADIRIGTLHSFYEALDFMGLVENVDYRFIGGNDPHIVFKKNRSIIQFIPIDNSKDREWHRLKSINATAAGVDEADGVEHAGYVMLASRVGRKNRSGAPAVVITTCNPNEAWVSEHVYKPWKEDKLGSGVAVIEYQMRDSFLYAEGFYDRFADNPEEWKQRYLFNNWEYTDDSKSLFKSRALDAMTVQEYDAEATRYVGNDVAREGVDRSVFARIHGDTLVDLKLFTRDDIRKLSTTEQQESGNIPWGSILGRELMDYCAKYEAGYENTAVDAVGNGGGVVDHCRDNGFNVNEFKAGWPPIGKKVNRRDRRGIERKVRPDYDMLRSQLFHRMANDIETGKFKLWAGCPHLADLKKELLYHRSETKDRLMKVEHKDEIKKRLGKSPDIADAVCMAYYNKVKTADSLYDADSIGWSGKVSQPEPEKEPSAT